MKQQVEILLSQALTQYTARTGHVFSKAVTIQLEQPKDPTHGDCSTNLALVLAKEVGMPPRIFAEKLLQDCVLPDMIASVSVAGPGFINFRWADHYWTTALQALWTSPTLGVRLHDAKTTVVVDYSSPNLAKEMHVGHLRSTIIGDAIARILKFKGFHVVRQNHVGDWGTQFGMLLTHLEDEVTEQDDLALRDLESFYKAAKQRFDTDDAFAARARLKVVALQSGDLNCRRLWSRFIALSLTHCEAVYALLGVALTRDDVRAESAYQDDLMEIVEDLRAQGLLQEHEGAQCVFLQEFKSKSGDILPIIVQKNDGGFLYATTDLAALRYRQEVLHAARILYVVDARQSLHFQQMFALARQAGWVKPEVQLTHVSFGMVLDAAGKPFKSREGGVTKLIDLLEESLKRARQLLESRQVDKARLDKMARVIGIASVKYADLSKHRAHDYVFNWDTMISFEGNTAPYLLYAYTRIQRLFEKAGDHAALDEVPCLMLTPVERALSKHLLEFSDVIDGIVETLTPHVLCTYLYELAGLFSSFYEACPILQGVDEAVMLSRLKLSQLTAHILSQGLALLGIETLTNM